METVEVLRELLAVLKEIREAQREMLAALCDLKGLGEVGKPVSSMAPR